MVESTPKKLMQLDSIYGVIDKQNQQAKFQTKLSFVYQSVRAGVQ